MAKSARSKIKRHFRAKKRTEGIYAAVEAARLNRLALKLKAISTADDEGERMQQDPAQAQGGGEGEGEWEDMPDDQQADDAAAGPDAMALDSGSSTDAAKLISTHGPRGSRHEEWRASKGMAPRSQSRGINRQGGVKARRKAGRPQRRR
ncbi:hypothetical protein SCP_0204630 [Sparassis crispa]|uniref:DUF2423 domain-containing protein n=1 Tax=Sparassis crispa TaxID=139825 RepID=A0A401GAS5_9APHY|nr:hypothetical protein SCP_0204630 [Sparassis crispa]GBE79265.1 hypothetical protein SCP_0204630 [Sparassis crispa]